MSETENKDSKIDDTTSTDENLLGSSISLTIDDNSIHVKEKFKLMPKDEIELKSKENNENWWIKKPSAQLQNIPDNAKTHEHDAKVTESSIASPEISSSMRDFLEKEKMCKEVQNNNFVDTEKDDTLCDVFETNALDKYQSDFDSATDDDIGSMLDEMNKIAGSMSPIPESMQSKNNNEFFTDEEHSVKQLLQEAEQLVNSSGNNNNNNNINNNTASGLSNTINTESDEKSVDNINKINKLDLDIFKMLEKEISDESQKISDSTNKKQSNLACLPLEVLFENINSAKVSEVHTKSNGKIFTEANPSEVLDYVEGHTVSDKVNGNNAKKIDEKNLKKEITDVDKDFFDALVDKSKEEIQDFTQNANFDQEDFAHFLKLLQEQSDKSDNNLSTSSSLNLLSDPFDPLKTISPNEKKEESVYLLEKELMTVGIKKTSPENEISKSMIQSTDSVDEKNHKLPKKPLISPRSAVVEAKRVENSKNELYTVVLTPRLELFADDIPKLLAEKSNEDKKQESDKEISPKSEADGEDFSFKNFKELKQFNQSKKLKDHTNIEGVQDYKDLIDFDDNSNSKYLQDFGFLQDTANSIRFNKNYDQQKVLRVVKTPESKLSLKEELIPKSKSYDQLSKHLMKVGSASNSANKTDDFPLSNQFNSRKPSTVKTRNQLKTAANKLPVKTKMPLRVTKEPLRKDNFDIKGSQMKTLDNLSKYRFGGGGDTFKKGGTFEESLDSLELLYQEERSKFMHIKHELESEIEAYKGKIKDIQLLHEQEMFSLKKQNILLKAKIDENLHKEKKENKSKNEEATLRKELERLENVISVYESENKKLIQQVKHLQIEVKKNTQRPKIVLGESSDLQLMESVKELQEENITLNNELTNYKEKNNDLSIKTDDLIQQNSLLQEELDMIKDQLKTKNDYIADRLQIMTNTELDLRKQLEDLKVELSSKTEQLKFTRNDYEKLQQSIVPMEKELYDLRAKSTHFQEKLQISKNNCEKEKQLTQRLKDQVILDNKRIVDLNRQVREMERILKRKHPDSVSALLLTANSENEKLQSEKTKLLEEKIAFLENEIKVKEHVAQEKIEELHNKFASVKEKYAATLGELEEKKATSESSKIFVNAFVQTDVLGDDKDVEFNSLDKEDRKVSNKIGPKSQNTKEDTHLIATIRGLKTELANKDKIVANLKKEYQEIQKTNRKLQKEREKLLNDKRNVKGTEFDKLMTQSDSKLTSLRMAERNDPNSNFYQNGLCNGKKLSASAQKLYDPSQFSENSDSNKVKRLSNENDVLKQELSKMNKDFVALKNKRLQDLNLLQEEHEKEIEAIIKEYSSKVGDTKALKLQGQVNSQMAMISHLKQQIEKLQDYKEQVIVLKAEREHLEGKVRVMNEKIKYLSTPSSQQLQMLQEKIAILQQRHESREMTLQKLLRDLLRSKTQCQDCKGDRGKQLCLFRQELDAIIGMLQGLAET